MDYCLFPSFADLYSSHTSSSFSPSISDGMATPNSIINGGDGDKHDDHDNACDNKTNSNNNNKIIKNNNHTNSNCKSNDGTYHCQFCDKTFPRLGYLKKHEQVSQLPMKYITMNKEIDYINRKHSKIIVNNCIIVPLNSIILVRLLAIQKMRQQTAYCNQCNLISIHCLLNTIIF